MDENALHNGILLLKHEKRTTDQQLQNINLQISVDILRCYQVNDNPKCPVCDLVIHEEEDNYHLAQMKFKALL